MLLHVMWLATFAALGGPPAAGLMLAPLIIFNVISVNVDVSDPGFKFFYYAPFWHAAELIRNHLFGTLATRVSMHVGVLWAWFFAELPLFFLAHAKAAAREAAAKAAAAGPPVVAPAAAAAPASVEVATKGEGAAV